jgi:peptide/nickel transport system ATP-binding protein
LARLRRETGVAMLFISHDLAVVRKLADRTGVLFQGTLVEVGLTESIFEPPYHPYTEELLLAVPSFRDGLRGAIRPSMPRSGGSGGRGCVYARRCRSYRGSICDEEVPPWRTSPSGHAIRCHIPLPELAAESLIAEPSARDPAEEQRPSIPEVTT